MSDCPTDLTNFDITDISYVDICPGLLKLDKIERNNLLTNTFKYRSESRKDWPTNQQTIYPLT